MALRDEVRAVLRVSSALYDSEIDTLIASALFDMRNKGISEGFIGQEGSYPPMVRQAVALWCKANFGYDNDEATRFMQAYESIVCSLMASHNDGGSDG